ncbi:hypothetical protein [Micromonospora sp. NBC_01813]|uniref:hypothetical protein n=1 Tax=Micromonospora sp. NBC_01813 TaxID=2975988 RepID=UPI002DDC6FA0|nr:hypothetical protein [Micromonospora sp. NBC_01813]WSA08452.1 hypothetical protein OG958_30415 [Micromonospora sp. NBC_01813]
MDHAGPPDVLPLRPLTTGESLDAAVELLRAHAPVLLTVGAVLALAEQLLLLPLRDAAGAVPPAYLPTWNRLGLYWLLLAAGAAIEVTVIALLGGLTSRAAGAAILGERLSPWRLLDPRGGRFAAVAVVAGAAGTIMFTAALAGPVWFVAYAVLGLAVPALILDRVPIWQTLARSSVLAVRGGLRAGLIRVLGYLIFFAIRAGLGLGALNLTDSGASWLGVVAVAGWTILNAVVYPTLACLDAVLHIETRMRTEGLDLRLRRARSNAQRSGQHLVAGT